MSQHEKVLDELAIIRAILSSVGSYLTLTTSPFMDFYNGSIINKFEYYNTIVNV